MEHLRNRYLSLNSKKPLLSQMDEASNATDTMPKKKRAGDRKLKRKKEAAYANESMCREWRGPLQCYPESTADLWKGHWNGLGTRGPPRLDRLSLSLPLSRSLFLLLSVSRPLGLLRCGGGGELIIEAVKPSHSLVSVSNEVPTIKAL